MKPGCYLETGQIRCTGAFVGMYSVKLITCVQVDYTQSENKGLVAMTFVDCICPICYIWARK